MTLWTARAGDALLQAQATAVVAAADAAGEAGLWLLLLLLPMSPNLLLTATSDRFVAYSAVAGRRGPTPLHALMQRSGGDVFALTEH